MIGINLAALAYVVMKQMIQFIEKIYLILRVNYDAMLPYMAVVGAWAKNAQGDITNLIVLL